MDGSHGRKEEASESPEEASKSQEEEQKDKLPNPEPGVNPTFLRKNFQRRTYYRGKTIDERRNPLALFYFSGKEEELRRQASESVPSGDGVACGQHPSGHHPILHRTPTHCGSSADPYRGSTLNVRPYGPLDHPPVQPPYPQSFSRPPARSSFENFVLGSLRELEIKAEASRQDRLQSSTPSHRTAHTDRWILASTAAHNDQYGRIAAGTSGTATTTTTGRAEWEMDGTTGSCHENWKHHNTHEPEDDDEEDCEEDWRYRRRNDEVYNINGDGYLTISEDPSPSTGSPSQSNSLH